MHPRTATLKLMGVVTEPNEYGVFPAGACRVAENVLFRQPNKAVSACGLTNEQQYGVGGAATRQLLALENGHVLTLQQDAVNQWRAYVDGVESTGVAFPNALFNAAYMNGFTARAHAFLNSSAGVMVLDSLQPVTTADRRLRYAGLTQPVITQMGFDAGSTAAAIPASTGVAYCACWRRNSGDYSLISVPSPSWRVFNSGGAAVDVLLLLKWQASYDVQAGDILEIYRSNGINGTAADDPGVDFRLVTSYSLTTADVAAGQVTVYDRQPMTAPLYQTSGRALYCSEGQEGALSVNRHPPACKVMGTWGSFSFYGNITDRPQFTLSVPGGIGNHADTGYNTDAFRKYGVGQRGFTGNTTSGSPTVTSVSNTTGIVVGQVFIGGTAGFTAGSARVIGVTSTTVTFDQNCSATATGATSTLVDILQINGQEIWMTGVSGLVQQLGFFAGYEVTPNQTIPFGDAGAVYVKNFVATIEPMRQSLVTQISVRATNGANYAPPLPEINDSPKVFTETTRPNLMRWSRDNEPEHVRLSDETFVGFGDIVAFRSTRDAAWFFCTDGIYILTGAGGVWDVRSVVKGCVPVAPGATTRMLDQVFAYTNRGLVEVTSTGILELSTGLVEPNRILTSTVQLDGLAFQETRRVRLSCDEQNREVYLLIQGPTIGSTSFLLAYATLYRAFSTISWPDMRISDITYQPTTGVAGINGRPLVSLAQGGAAVPSVSVWDSVSGATMNPIVLLQPVFATEGATADPWTAKRWVDTSWLFDPTPGSYELVGTYNDIEPYATNRLTNGKNDARCSFGVPRSDARSPAISPGMRTVTPPGAPLVFRGASLRYRNVSTQDGER